MAAPSAQAVSVAAPVERNDAHVVAPVASQEATVSSPPAPQAPGKSLRAAASAGPGRLRPQGKKTTTLADAIRRPNAEDRAVFPSLPAAHDANAYTPAIFQTPVNHNQPAATFADVAALADLEPLEMRTIPKIVRDAIGLSVEALPLLPKRNPHLYHTSTFVTQLKYSYENVDVALASEDYWRRNALKRAERITIVQAPGARPYLFLHKICATDLPTPVAMRTTVTTVATTTRIAFDAGPRVEPHVLQGTLSLLAKHASDVQLKWIIGKDGDVEYWEALGVPKTPDWRDHLLGVPLELVVTAGHASRRATVRMKESAPRFAERFGHTGFLAHQSREKFAGFLVNGFEARAFSNADFTQPLKKALAEMKNVKSVFTDLKMKAAVPRVGDAPSTMEVEAVAVQHPANEVVYAHAPFVFSPDQWSRLAAAAGLTVLSACPTFAALRGARAAQLDGATVGEVLLAATPLG